jgi:uncharacterized protein YciI
VVRPANRHLLGERFAAGGIFASGAFADDAAPGALRIVNAENPEHPAELVDGDPFSGRGLVTQPSVRPWSQLLGPRVAGPV